MKFHRTLLLSLCLLINISISDAIAKDKMEVEKMNDVISESGQNQQIVNDVEINEVSNKLEHFVRYFVEEFEEKLTLYSLELDGKIKKAGKSAKLTNDALGGLIGFAAGKIPMVGGVVKSVSTNLIADEINKIGENYHLGKVTELSKLVDFSQEGSADFRRMLVNAGFDLFQSFEAQFMMVTSRTELRQLAKDAVDRAINYMKNKSEFEEKFITQGVILGKSKKQKIKDKIPYLDSGFNIKFHIDYNGTMYTQRCNTSALYETVGIVLSEGGKNIFYSHKDESDDPNSGSFHYGYRRLLISENWNELKEQYQRDIDGKAERNKIFSDYKYILSPQNMEEKSKIILAEINLKDKGLIEERIAERSEDIRSDILEQIENLKQMNIAQMESFLHLIKIEDGLREAHLKEIDQHLEKAKREYKEIIGENYKAIQTQMTRIEMVLDKLLNSIKG